MNEKEVLEKGGTPKRKRTTIDKRAGKIVVYDITKNELLTLQRGGEQARFKDISIFTLSISATIFITFYSSGFNTEKETGFFLGIATTLAVIGGASSVLYYKKKKEIKQLCDDIRNRSE